ncbi:hypothetical protein, conserved [Plasmodium gonderi]|uniref:Uncharacterized protein n=1 Tax=Plasmodium gonderi TaxID=77519 RepID=A0A1Y1JMC7_PLAGO|nr:hypothetical protein, conserved [Plasmodium gonderi]GAW83390.1 hypothetical protein, conserved [Plasmodium gonderi]
MHSNELYGPYDEIEGEDVKSINGEATKSNYYLTDQNEDTFSNKSNVSADNNISVPTSFSEDAPPGEEVKKNDETNSLIKPEQFSHMFKGPELDIMYKQDKGENKYYENNVIQNEELEASRKKKSLPHSYDHKSNYVKGTKNIITSKGNFWFINNGGNINEQGAKGKNKTMQHERNEETGKFLSFTDSAWDNTETEMKRFEKKSQIPTKYAKDWPNEKDEPSGQDNTNEQGNPNEQDNPNGHDQQNVRGKPKGHNELNKQGHKNKQDDENMQDEKKFQNEQPDSAIKKKENATNDHVAEKKNCTQKSKLHGQDLKKKKKNEQISNLLSSKLFGSRDLSIKSTQNGGEKNVIANFTSAKINNELSVLGLRKEKNREIIKNFEKFSLNSNSQKHIFNTLKNKKKYFDRKVEKCMDNSQENSSVEQIMVQKFFIQQSDTDIIVQKKINSIENILEETERKNMNNSLKKINSLKKDNERTNGNATISQNTSGARNEEGNDNMVQIRTSSISSSSFSNDQSKENENIEDINNDTHLRKHRNNQTNGAFTNNLEKNDYENPLDTSCTPFEYKTKMKINKKTNKIEENGTVQANENFKNNNVESKSESKGTSSESSYELADIKIYDDSEIEEAKESELEPFWLNREISSLLNKSTNYCSKYSDEFNINETVWNVGNNNNRIHHSTSVGYIEDEKIKKKIISPKMKKYESDIITSVKRKTSFFDKKNTVDNIAMNGRPFIMEEDNEEHLHSKAKQCTIEDISNCKYSTISKDFVDDNEKKENLDIFSKLDAIKNKISLINDIDIDNINFEKFDMYQIDFKKLGLKVDNLEKEEKYILMLYISQKKLECITHERGICKSAYDYEKGRQSNPIQMKEVKDNKLMYDSFHLEDANCEETWGERSKYMYPLTHKKNFYTNCITTKESLEEDKEERKNFLKSSPSAEINTSHNFSIPKNISLGLGTQKLVSDNYVHANTETAIEYINGINSYLSSKSNSSSGFHQLGLFFELYYNLSKQNSIMSNGENSNDSNANNEKILLKKILKNFIYLFLQDECIDELVKNYEDMKKAIGKEDVTLKNSICLQYICSSLLQDISKYKKDKQDEKMDMNSSLVFSEIVKEIGNKFLKNDQVMEKIKGIQIINRILREEVRTYSIKVACVDKYLDIEPHFIEETEKVIVGNDIGFFHMHILNSNYVYNYHKHEETKLTEQNNNPVWNFFYGYFNDIYNWYNDKNNNDILTPLQVENGNINKDISSSKRVSRNFIKQKKNEPKKYNEDIHKKEETYENSDKHLLHQDKIDSTMNNSDTTTTIVFEENDINESKDQQEISRSLDEKENANKNDPKDHVKRNNVPNENKTDTKMESCSISQKSKKYITNIKHEQGTIFSNSTNIEECLIESNISSIDNFISENYNKIGDSENVGTLVPQELDHYTVENEITSDKKNCIGNSREDPIYGGMTSESVPYLDTNMLYNNSKNSISSNNSLHCKKEPILNEQNKKIINDTVEAYLVTFQYKGSIPKDQTNEISKICRDKNKNIIGCYLSSQNDKSLIAVHMKNDKIENTTNAHFIVERCNKYNKEISNSYVHILNSSTKQYLAINLQNGELLFTIKYDDSFFIDERNVENRISTYFQLHSTSDMMKSIFIQDVVQSFADVILN